MDRQLLDTGHNGLSLKGTEPEQRPFNALPRATHFATAKTPASLQLIFANVTHDNNLKTFFCENRNKKK